MENWLDWLPIAASLIAVSLTALGLMLGWANRRSDGLWQYLNLLTSDAIVSSRDSVGAAARSKPGEKGGNRQEITSAQSGEDDAQNRRAIFQMFWVVQLARPVLLRYAKRSRSFGPELEEICAHLNLIVPDLSDALEKWGGNYDAEKSFNRTNEALKVIQECLEKAPGRNLSLEKTSLGGRASEGEDRDTEDGS